MTRVWVGAGVACLWLCACPPSGGGEGEGEGAAGEGEGEGVGEGEGEGEGTAAPFFLAVGYGGRRMISADGSAWTNDVADAANGGDDDNLLRGACAGTVNGSRVAVAVGGSNKGRALVTVDGATFATTLDDQLGWLGGCAVSDDGIIAAVGSGRSIRSVDGGATWIDAGTHFFGGNGWQMRDIAFGNGLFAAAGDLGVSTSVDGIAWTDPAGPAPLGHIAFGNGAWVAVGEGVRARSNDAAQWSTDAKPGVKSVTFDGARFVVVGDFLVHLSSDGVVWDEHGGEPALNLVASGGGAYVSSTFPDTRKRSTDALAWTDVAGDATNILSAIVYVQ